MAEPMTPMNEHPGLITQDHNPYVLQGLEAITAWLCVTRPTFYGLVEVGLPAIVINNRWYAHKKTLDEWFQHITRARMDRIPQDAE